jgi:transcription antitermination factor NusG
MKANATILNEVETEVKRIWHAIYVRHFHEAQVAKRFKVREIESYLPQYRVERHWKNRCTAKLDLPLFPGYLFARVSYTERVRILEVPSVLCLVGTAGRPTPLADEDMDALRDGLQARNAQPHSFLNVGERVRIRCGALVGMEGIVIRRKNGPRVVINLDFIMRSVAVDANWDDLEPSHEN